MTKAEKIAQAFGRGLAQGLVGANKEDDASSEPVPPQVIPMDAVRTAVREVLEPLIAEEQTPTQTELDLYTHGIEDAPADENAEMIRRRLEETRARREAQERQAEPEGTYDPNLPNLSPWTSPE